MVLIVVRTVYHPFDARPTYPSTVGVVTGEVRNGVEQEELLAPDRPGVQRQVTRPTNGGGGPVAEEVQRLDTGVEEQEGEFRVKETEVGEGRRGEASQKPDVGEVDVVPSRLTPEGRLPRTSRTRPTGAVEDLGKNRGPSSRST